MDISSGHGVHYTIIYKFKIISHNFQFSYCFQDINLVC